MALNRRAFLQSSFVASVFALGAPSRLLGSIAPVLQRTPDGVLGVYAIAVSKYSTLGTTYGCVRITIPSMPNLGGILVTRVSAAKFTAVSEICTHQGCTINLFSATKKYFLCPCHRSTFASDGTVISGPAQIPLTSYATTYDGVDTVSLQIPGLVGVGEQLPAMIDVHEFAPNPVSSAGVLRYTLHDAASVSIVLFDITGREVARVAEGRRTAGMQQEQVDVSALRPGTYVVRIAVNGKMADTRRIAVVR